MILVLAVRVKSIKNAMAELDFLKEMIIIGSSYFI
jgi:hypothetical protein